MALLTTPEPELGTPAPDFSLPGTDGATHALADYDAARVLIVAFICNHCPYVVAIRERLVALAQENAPRGVQLVAISANDAARYPADSFEKMTALAEELAFPFPYLYDESQEIAQAYGAVCTPDFFVYDAERRLAYRGRMDDSWKDASAVTSRDLQDAVDALLRGESPSGEQHPSMGCSIKWRY